MRAKCANGSFLFWVLRVIESAGFVFRDYQWVWLNDQSRLKIMLKSRQVGISEMLVVGAVMEAVSNPGRNCFFVSTNFRKAKDLVAKCAKWVEAIVLADPALADAFKITVSNTDKIEFANGSRIVALPCKASAVRGETGTVRIDEPAHIQNAYEIFLAIAPAIVSNPNLRLELSSTPLGESGLFYDIWIGKLGGDWSRHKVDVYDAVADGFTPTVLELRSAYTEDGWAQEFECAFVADGERYFQNALLQKGFALAMDLHVKRVSRKFLGIDVASKKDRTVAFDLYENEQKFYAGDHSTLSRSGDTMTYPQQFEVLKHKIKNGNYAGVAVDATGEGAGLAAFLRQEFGNLVKEVKFTHPWKEKHIPAMKRDIERGVFGLPDDPAVINSFGKIKRNITIHDNLNFVAERDGDGHADEFYALLLAYSMAKVFPYVAADETEIVVHKAKNSLAKKIMGY